MRRLVAVVALSGGLTLALLTGCASGPSPEEVERLDRQRQQAAEAQQAMEEAKRQEQARQAQAQRERVAIEQAEQKVATTEKTGNSRGAMMDYASALRQLEDATPAWHVTAPADVEALGQRIRKKIFTLAQRLDPAPALPEEAERHLIRGQMAFKTAKNTPEFDEAAKEFRRATVLAPWWAEAYYNLGLSQAQAGHLADAVASLKLYVQAAPKAADVKEVKAKIIELEYAQEQSVRRIQGWQGLYRIEQSESRYLEHLIECGSAQIRRQYNFHPSLLRAPLEISIESVDFSTKRTTARLLRSTVKDLWGGTVDEANVVLHAGDPTENGIEIKRMSDSLQLQAKVRYHFVEDRDGVPCDQWGRYEGPIEKVNDGSGK